MNQYTTTNPTSGQPLNNYPIDCLEDIYKKISAASLAQKKWKTTSHSVRKEKLLSLAENFTQHKSLYAKIMAEEMGKPIQEGLGEIEKCVRNCEYYAENLAAFLRPEKIVAEDIEAYKYYEPVGLIYAVMPWNFPFWQVMRFAIPNLAAGNGIILKHAKNVIGSALAIEKAFTDAGFPSHLVTNVIIDHDASEKIIDHPDIQGVTLTGSDQAGKIIAAQSGKALKKVILELGGSDPYLILEDADITHAVEQCVKARMLNAGQVCISPKRIIVHEHILDAFIEQVKTKLSKYQFGDPLNADCKLGPMAKFSLRDELHAQVQESIQKGAKCLLGGVVPKGEGNYYPATLLTNVKKGMPAYDEELFGPVVAIISASTEEEAIEIANDSKYGLGAAIFSQDIQKARDIAVNQIDSGMCSINAFVASDPRIPFGGVKQSGFGREVALEGMREFVNIKSIVVG